MMAASIADTTGVNKGPAVPARLTSADAPMFAALGVLSEQFVAAVLRLYGDQPFEVAAALALAVRGPSFGHVCVDLANTGDVGSTGDEPFVWPIVERWIDELRRSALEIDEREALARLSSADGTASESGDALLVLAGSRLYLRRYFEYEHRVASALSARAVDSSSRSLRGGSSASAVDAVLDRFFPQRHRDGFGPAADRQLAAVLRALDSSMLLLAGGPGTGKTRTVAVMLLAMLAGRSATAAPLRIALAAPTGKAAARMTEAVLAEVGDGAEVEIVGRTLHRLLGFRHPDHRSADGFIHDATNPLPFDVVIVDEVSMVSLPLMVSLLDATPPSCRLVLVGDPYQLASVEAGSVLRDIVGPALDAEAREASPTAAPAMRSALADDIVILNRSRRFRPDSQIAYLADAIRQGDVPAAVSVLNGAPDRYDSVAEVNWVRLDPSVVGERVQRDTAIKAVLRQAPDLAVDLDRMVAAQVEAARTGNASDALAVSTSMKLLCATRIGPLGSERWNDVLDATARAVLGPWSDVGRWFLGRPMMVTQNDYLNELFNGDSGVVALDEDDEVRVAFPFGDRLRFVDRARLDTVEPNWAMTVHKSQGSEFDHVVVILPPPPMNLLTRELLYTAVTRAKKQVTLISMPESIELCVTQRIQRPSGLTERLLTMNDLH